MVNENNVCNALKLNAVNKILEQEKSPYKQCMKVYLNRRPIWVTPGCAAMVQFISQRGHKDFAYFVVETYKMILDANRLSRKWSQKETDKLSDVLEDYLKPKLLRWAQVLRSRELQKLETILHEELERRNGRP